MALGGLVFMDVGGFFRGGLGNTVVARIGNQKIDIYEFNKTAERLVQAQQMTMQEAYQFGFLNMVVQGMIAQTLTDQSAQALGLDISKAQVEKTLAKVVDTYRQEGQTRAEVLKNLIESQGLSEKSLTEETKGQLRRALVSNAFTAPTLLIPDNAAQALKMFQAEQRDVIAFKVKTSDIAFEEKATDEILRTFYNETKQSYVTPETRDIEMLSVSAGLFEDKVKITEEVLQAQYDDEIDSYKLPEQRFLEQAILDNEKDASTVLKKASNGQTLKSALRSVTNKTDGYRKETAFQKDGLLDALSDLVFDAEKTGYLEIAKSPLGWHVINLKKIEEPRTQGFEEVRKSLRRTVLQTASDDMMIDLLDRIEERLIAGDSLQEIAQANNLKVVEIKNIPNDVNKAGELFLTEGMFEIEDLMTGIFDSDIGEPTDPIETDMDTFTLVEVKSVTETGFKPFEDVKEELEKEWIKQEHRTKLRKAVGDVVTRLNTKDTDFDFVKAALEFGVKTSAMKNLSREDNVPELLTEAAMNALFLSTATGTAAFKPDGTDGFVVYKATKADYPDTLNEEPLSVQKLQLTRPTEAALDELYYGYLTQSKTVVTNTALLQRLYGGEAGANQ